MSTQICAHVIEFTILRPPESSTQPESHRGRSPCSPHGRTEPLLRAAAYLKEASMKPRECPTRGGATGGTRTHNLLITNQLLCQLSHGSKWGARVTYPQIMPCTHGFFSPGTTGGIRTHGPRIKSPLRYLCATVAYKRHHIGDVTEMVPVISFTALQSKL